MPGSTFPIYRRQDEDENEPDENEPDENEPDEDEGGSSVPAAAPSTTAVASTTLTSAIASSPATPTSATLSQTDQTPAAATQTISNANPSQQVVTTTTGSGQNAETVTVVSGASEQTGGTVTVVSGQSDSTGGANVTSQQSNSNDSLSTGGIVGIVIAIIGIIVLLVVGYWIFRRRRNRNRRKSSRSDSRDVVAAHYGDKDTELASEAKIGFYGGLTELHQDDKKDINGPAELHQDYKPLVVSGMDAHHTPAAAELPATEQSGAYHVVNESPKSIPSALQIGNGTSPTVELAGDGNVMSRPNPATELDATSIQRSGQPAVQLEDMNGAAGSHPSPVNAAEEDDPEASTVSTISPVSPRLTRKPVPPKDVGQE